MITVYGSRVARPFFKSFGLVRFLTTSRVRRYGSDACTALVRKFGGGRGDRLNGRRRVRFAGIRRLSAFRNLVRRRALRTDRVYDRGYR